MIDVKVTMRYKDYDKKLKITKSGKISDIAILYNGEYLNQFFRCAIYDDSFESRIDGKNYQIIFPKNNVSELSEELKKACKRKAFSLEKLELDNLGENKDTNEFYFGFKVKDTDSTGAIISETKNIFIANVTFSLNTALIDALPKNQEGGSYNVVFQFNENL